MKANALDTVSKHNWFQICHIDSGRFLSFTTTKNGNTLWGGTYKDNLIKLEGINYLDLSDSMAYNKTASLQRTGFKIAGNTDRIEGIAVTEDETTILAGVAGYSNLPNVRLSKDGGVTWQSIQVGPLYNPAYACVINKHNLNQYLVGTEHGIWSSNDGGATWQPDNDTFCVSSVTRLRQLPFGENGCTALYAATNGQGIWRSFSFTPQGCDLSVSVDKALTNQPEPLLIFPNPSNDFVQLKTDATLVGKKLEAYNALGEMIWSETLMTEIKTLHIGNWPSGIYIVRCGSSVVKLVVG